MFAAGQSGGVPDAARAQAARRAALDPREASSTDAGRFMWLEVRKFRVRQPTPAPPLL